MRLTSGIDPSGVVGDEDFGQHRIAEASVRSGRLLFFGFNRVDLATTADWRLGLQDLMLFCL